MNIGLIDVDHSNFPNIALMKLSAWHKAQGDHVEWYTPFERYDIVYVAKVFAFSEDWREPINADRVIKGGSGYMIRTIDGKEGWYPFEHHKEAKRRGYKFMDELPYHIEHIYPDYSLYPMYTKNTAYGFLTRGCPRGCEFCHVADKEGKKSYKASDLLEMVSQLASIGKQAAEAEKKTSTAQTIMAENLGLLHEKSDRLQAIVDRIVQQTGGKEPSNVQKESLERKQAYCKERESGKSIRQAGEAVGVSYATAKRYERFRKAQTNESRDN